VKDAAEGERTLDTRPEGVIPPWMVEKSTWDAITGTVRMIIVDLREWGEGQGHRPKNKRRNRATPRTPL
jgi:hypothetical protein